MDEALFDWVTRYVPLSSSNVIDLYFYFSDLIDIPITEAEHCEMVCCDSLATHVVESAEAGQYGNIPNGKLVL